jgi:transposase
MSSRRLRDYGEPEVGMVVGEQQCLIEVSAVEGGSAESCQDPRAAVGKVFRAYEPGQVMLLPPSLDEWLPAEHLARFVDELVEQHLDLEPLYAAHTNVKGFPPYDPRMMLKLLLYGYVTGVRSSRKLEAACVEQVAFRFLAANQTPDHRAFSRFRRRHLAAMDSLFLQVLGLCQTAGMVKLGNVGLDGTKVRANASRHKAMSYQRMVEREPELAAIVKQILEEAEAVDQAEDERYGDARGDELPEHLRTKQGRLEAIRAAKVQLEAEAAEQAADQARGRERRKAERRGEDPDDPAVVERCEQAATDAAATAVPKPKAQRNFTDPQSRIMKTSDGSFHQCYNAQAVVDETHQVIVATELTAQAADAPHLPGLLAQTLANVGTPARLLADAGYWSQANYQTLCDAGIDGYIATGRCKHNEAVPAAPRGRIPKDATPKQRMARKLRTKKGRAIYARRKVIPEPVFGQMKTLQGAGQLLLRGHDAASAEWKLHATVHNLRKLFAHRDKFPSRDRGSAPTTSPAPRSTVGDILTTLLSSPHPTAA